MWDDCIGIWKVGIRKVAATVKLEKLSISHL